MKARIISTFVVALSLSATAFGHQAIQKKKGCYQYDNNWQLVDEYVHANSNGEPTITYPVGMYVSKHAAGKVYVTGVSLDVVDGQYDVKSIIRRTLNFGNTWSTSGFVYESEMGSAAIHMVEAPNQRLLYLAESHVFSSTNNAGSFTEIANLSLQFPQYDNLVLLSAVTSGNSIYMVADAKRSINGSYSWRGLLFKSTDNGATWTLKKEFSKGDANRTWLTSVAVKSNGAVVVGGYVYDGSNYYWLVDQSNSSVTSWTELETTLAPGTGLSYVRALIVNSSDKVLAIGPVGDSSSFSTYIRKYSSSVSTVYQSAPGIQGTHMWLAENGSIYFPYTQSGMARMAISYNDGNSWNESWSAIDASTYSYEMGEDKKNSLYVSSQDGDVLKTYKLECKKSSHMSRQ